MPLDLSTFLAMASACAPAAAPSTLLAVARVESGVEPFAIGVNGQPGLGLHPRSKAGAIQAAEALIAANRNIDLGIAQINVRNLARLRLTVADAFDPCRNLAAATTLLASEFQRAATTQGEGQAALKTALSRYNTGDDLRGFRNGYVARVVHAAQLLAPQAVAPRPDAKPTASWDVFGDLRTASFVSTSPLNSQGDQP